LDRNQCPFSTGLHNLFLEVGLAGMLPGGGDDPGFRGREPARNAAAGHLAAAPGLLPVSQVALHRLSQRRFHCARVASGHAVSRNNDRECYIANSLKTDIEVDPTISFS
jgi:hypothetical protein